MSKPTHVSRLIVARPRLLTLNLYQSCSIILVRGRASLVIDANSFTTTVTELVYNQKIAMGITLVSLVFGMALQSLAKIIEPGFYHTRMPQQQPHFPSPLG